VPISALRIDSDSWQPAGVDALEPNALEVVRSDNNRSVIAGPGAGKTELLAQRAAYLLQTGLSPSPRRILAISFKRDAASNLAARVRKRCHRTHAERLDSMTFDAFAKGLLDRFGQALPARWRPRPNFEIAFPTARDFREFLYREIGPPSSSVGTYADIQAISAETFERRHLVGSPLPEDGWLRPTPQQWAADCFWQRALHQQPKSLLSFPMIGRLVELMLRTNPMIRDALKLAYSHLFLDEFQDTTQIQYDLVHTIFSGSETVITAVGDNKQQIMRWAMAMDDSFDVFERDFNALRTPLYNNYRSSPDLVRIQHVLAKALDDRAVVPVSKATGSVSGLICAVMNFSTPAHEASKLASIVSDQIKLHGLTPRDFVVLVRQKAAEYADVLGPAFASVGISLRNEADKVGKVPLQDLLTDPVSELVYQILRLATSKRSGKSWSACQAALLSLGGVQAEDEKGQAKVTRELDQYAIKLRMQHPRPPTAKPESRRIVDSILDFVGQAKLVAAYPVYGHGGWLEEVIESVSEHLLASTAQVADWSVALDNYEGINALPLMTIHKSKGLEYHTVMFVGLDDGAWWSFNKDEYEATAGFFVAFTRAKQRVLFTYCARRGGKQVIATLYGLLDKAGVKIIDSD